jgi:hypothetical protein
VPPLVKFVGFLRAISVKLYRIQTAQRTLAFICGSILDEHQRRLNKFDGRICPRYVWISAAALEFESGGIFSVNKY